MAIFDQNSEWLRNPFPSASSSSNTASHRSSVIYLLKFMWQINSARLNLWSLLRSASLKNPLKIFSDYFVKTHVEFVESIQELLRISDFFPLPEFLMRKISILIHIECIKKSTPISSRNDYYNFSLIWHSLYSNFSQESDSNGQDPRIYSCTGPALLALIYCGLNDLELIEHWR